MRFPYQPYPAEPSPADRSGEIWRPALIVRVLGLQGNLDLWGILDTGATESVPPYAVHEAIEAARRADDIGVLLDAGGHPSVLEYGTVDLEVVIKGRPRRWSAKVAFDRRREQEALWGHIGFLEHFNATFNGPERHATLRPSSTFPKPFMPTK